jgi:hypothetical protein
MNTTALIKSKIVRQQADEHTFTTVNTLESNIYKDGITINVNGLISSTPIRIITAAIIDENPPAGYWIDESDSNKLKLYDGTLVTGGIRVISNDLLTSGISWTTTDKVYNVVNGVPLNYIAAGYYIDLVNLKLTTVTGLLGTAQNTENGVYYRNLGNKLWNVDGGSGSVAVDLIDDTYLLNAPGIDNIHNKIYDVSTGILVYYNNKFINRTNNNYYDNQQIIGTSNIGSVFFCDDKILIRTNYGYKKSILSII